MIVCVKAGRNLKSADMNGFSDPYVELQVGRNKQRTKIVKKNLNPVWDQKFVFDVDNPEIENITLRVYDHDRFSSDDFLGSAVVRLAGLVRGRDNAMWLPLQATTTGEVYLSIQPVDFGLDPSQYNSSRWQPPTNATAPPVTYPSSMDRSFVPPTPGASYQPYQSPRYAQPLSTPPAAYPTLQQPIPPPPPPVPVMATGAGQYGNYGSQNVGVPGYVTGTQQVSGAYPGLSASYGQNPPASGLYPSLASPSSVPSGLSPASISYIPPKTYPYQYP
jgi:hypothetical protein